MLLMLKWAYMQWVKNQKGFTIVELLVVVVVIVILATIISVSYTTVQKQALEVSLKSDLVGIADQLVLDSLKLKEFPATLDDANGGKGVEVSNGATLRYRPDNTATQRTFCLTGVNEGISYMITESGPPKKGGCYNVALGASSPSSILTDGVTTTSPYYSVSGVKSVTVDLDAPQIISSVKVWHYYGDGRTYYDAVIEVSKDGSNWQTVFDSDVDGTYQETSAGHTVEFSPREVRYIRDSISGNSVNGATHWVEVQAY